MTLEKKAKYILIASAALFLYAEINHSLEVASNSRTFGVVINYLKEKAPS